MCELDSETMQHDMCGSYFCDKQVHLSRRRSDGFPQNGLLDEAAYHEANAMYGGANCFHSSSSQSSYFPHLPQKPYREEEQPQPFLCAESPASLMDNETVDLSSMVLSTQSSSFEPSPELYEGLSSVNSSGWDPASASIQAEPALTATTPPPMPPYNLDALTGPEPACFDDSASEHSQQDSGSAHVHPEIVPSPRRETSQKTRKKVKDEEKFLQSPPMRVPDGCIVNIGEMYYCAEDGCRGCEPYTSKQTAGEHWLSTHADVRWKCLHCERVFVTSSGARRHYRSVHQGLQYHCYLCRKAHSTRYNLERHV